MNLLDHLFNFIRNFSIRFATISTEVKDGQSGWSALRSQPNDRDFSEAAQLYRDALEATRRNPMAKSIVDITTDFVLGDGISISSPHGRMQRFLERFWHHELNRIDQRLQSISDELARAGDLFVVLFRNQQDGMSYKRFVTKEQIIEIETADNDWETEIAYLQVTEDPTQPKRWLSPFHPDANLTHLERMIQDAYPFGERKRYPYKIWLDEVKKTMQELRSGSRKLQAMRDLRHYWVKEGP